MNKFIANSKLFLKRNSSLILTCVGAVGVIATAVSAALATPKAISRVRNAEEKKGEKLNKLEVVRTAAPVYIPSVLIGASTLGCIFGANALNKRQQAALTSAYALLDSSYKEYRNKVKEIFAEEGDRRVMEDIMEDRIEHEKASDKTDGKQRFFDLYSLQFFESTFEEVLKAEEFMNTALESRGYASLSEFYEQLGLPIEEYSFGVGWSLMVGSERYGYDRIVFEHEQVIMNNGEEVWVISLPNEPTPDYF